MYVFLIMEYIYINTCMFGCTLCNAPVNEDTFTALAWGRSRGNKARDMLRVAVKFVAVVTVTCSKKGAIEKVMTEYIRYICDVYIHQWLMTCMQSLHC